METLVKDKQVIKKAFGLGVISVFAYLANYYTKSLFSVAANR